MSTIIGIDGVQPIYDEYGKWQWFSLPEIWMGLEGKGKFIPKVNDYVIDPLKYDVYIVESLEGVNLIPKLRQITPSNMSFTFSETDVMFGVGPGSNNDKFRVYLDTTVIPYEISVDPRCHVPGSNISHYKLFKGSITGDGAECISKVYDSANKLISQSVQLETYAIDNHTNYAYKSCPPCKCTTNMQDGEIVTLVIYYASGSIAMKTQLLVENTNFIKSLNGNDKFVSFISLESPFLSPTVSNLLEYPLNVPANGLNMIGVVNYSDGSKLRLPVDGTRFKMLGLDQFVSNNEGQEFKLVLQYALGNNESAENVSSYNNKTINEPFKLITVNSNLSYSVKLFGYPVFVNTNVGYTLKWFLFNMDRNMFFDVTPYIRFNQSKGYFDGKQYGVLQKKSVSVNLKDISTGFKNYTHVQLIDIVLNGDPGSVGNEWNVLHSSVLGKVPYGNNVFATKIEFSKISLKSGHADFSSWVNDFYSLIYPLFNQVNEFEVPQPTHFIIMNKGVENEYDITNWDKTLTITNDVDIYSTLFIRWIKRTSSGDLELGISAVLVKP